jgi:hypothetical protein
LAGNREPNARQDYPIERYRDLGLIKLVEMFR